MWHRIVSLLYVQKVFPWHAIDVAVDFSVFNQKIGEWKGRFNEMQQQKFRIFLWFCVVVKSIY